MTNTTTNTTAATPAILTPRLSEPTTTKPCEYLAPHGCANLIAHKNAKRAADKTSKAWNEYNGPKAIPPRCQYARTMSAPIAA